MRKYLQLHPVTAMAIALSPMVLCTSANTSELPFSDLQTMTNCADVVALGVVEHYQPLPPTSANKEALYDQLMQFRVLESYKGAPRTLSIKFAHNSAFPLVDDSLIGKQFVVFVYRDTDGHYLAFHSGHGFLAVTEYSVNTRTVLNQEPAESPASLGKKIRALPMQNCQQWRYYSPES